MSKKLHYSLVGVLCALIFQTCKKAAPAEEPQDVYRCSVTSIAGQQNDILGKWKLVSYRTVFFNPDTTDYSCDHIIYEFKRDGRLTITSDIDEPRGYTAGDYPFELETGTAIEDGTMSYSLAVGEHSQWPAMIKPRELILSQAYLDGPVMHFLRVE